MGKLPFTIERIRVDHLQLPLVHPFETSFGLETTKDTVLVRLDADGLTGWGEAPVHDRPSYSPDDVVTTLHVLLDFMAPALIGRTFEGPEDLESDPVGIRGHRFARAAVELALTDLAARAAGLPLYRYYGGTRSRIPVGVSIGIQPDLEALLDRIGMFLDLGYGRIKVKIKPGWDIAVIEAIRSRYPDIMLFVDANAAYSLADSQMFLDMDRFGLSLIEQPLEHDDLVNHARLQAVLNTPVCLDESLAGLAASRSALRLKAAGAVNIKMPRMGGGVDSRRLAELGRRMGLPVFCGGMLETGIGRAHNMALATLAAFSLPGDISASDRYYEKDIVDRPAVLDGDGCLELPEAPGIGVAVVEDRVAGYSRFSREFRR